MLSPHASARLDGLSLKWHTPTRGSSPPVHQHPGAPSERGSMDVLTWIIVGLVAGLLASFVMGGIGFGILGDIIIGILGALFGGWLFGRMGWSAPASGIAGTIFVAFIGAVVLLLIIRLLRGARRAP
jgi:uncharacterized membrane protein YeaQ/YmgE (transglycosylase-associated protein family)